ncbi:hypothetical protein [Demequina muriae]|uniref:Uncharacterized protein n=1 Tax=Demequina muriae TaxID=3051664 RepID=A0ABT8GHM4_9MICO|nr:hypothetical protein [Demequina sp. EGI L300058]MDN4480451.1 hypothetical protein [Demequina sp. EGI L300058]
MTELAASWEGTASGGTVQPPALLLPIHPLDEAYAALGRALGSLAQAQDLDWVSVAAAQYRSELAEVEVRVRRLTVAVDWCREDWHRARTLAWMHGHS